MAYRELIIGERVRIFFSINLIVVSCLLILASQLQINGGEYLVSDRATNQILRYDSSDGSYLGPFVNDNMATNGGLFQPAAMTYGFDNDLFVTSIDLNTGDGQVLRYDGMTGAFEGIYADNMVGPAGVHFHEPSSTMLVGSLGTGLGDSNTIYRFDADGVRQNEINEGPITGRTGMATQADGTLLVSGFAEQPFFNGAVLEYKYDSGTDSFSYEGEFATAMELAGANGLILSNEGDVFVASLFGQFVVKFDVENDVVVSSSLVGQAAYPSGLFQESNGSLLVTSLGNNNPNDPIYPELFPGSVFKFDPTTGAMIGEGPFMVGGEEFLPTAILLRPEPSVGVSGDFDTDGQLTAADIDALSAVVRQGTNDAAFDMTGDGTVDDNDRKAWLDAIPAYPGDANLDGEFNSGDMILAFSEGQYEDGIPGNSGWVTGDWTGDGEFDTGDMLLAFQSGGYEQGPRAAIASVPEPATLMLAMECAFLLLVARRARK